jgi:protein translocase SecG subunit
MTNLLNSFQIFLAVFLILLVLIQGKGSLFQTQFLSFSKRGIEKKLYILTWVLGFLFLLVTFLTLIFSKK